ncbi:MAG: TM2 domain-containing protein [Halieaceae bacterium]|jgi:hypothetical protein|nr:TM2 domain-containing protein [Halieaceae bacterium]
MTADRDAARDGAQPAIDPDFAPEVVADLYRFRPRRLLPTAALALPLGIVGAHRFYLGRFWSGLFMLLTAGGGLLWWLWDLSRLRRLIDASNTEGREREAEGLPPWGMGFLPPQQELCLDAPPAWAAARSGRQRVFYSALLLFAIGLVLGGLCRSTQSYEPAFVLTLFIVVSLIASRVKGVAKIPVLNALVRWVHRLRLFYHSVDPGSIRALITRPIFGIFFAIWRPKIRAEVRLHLQMGGLVVLVLTALDALQLATSEGFWSGVGLLAAEFAQTLLCTYVFVAPASALLTSQLLLARRDHVVWALSAITLFALYLGLFA